MNLAMWMGSSMPTTTTKGRVHRPLIRPPERHKKAKAKPKPVAVAAPRAPAPRMQEHHNTNLIRNLAIATIVAQVNRRLAERLSMR